MEIAPDFDINLFVMPKEAYQWVLSKVKRWDEAQSKDLSRAKIWKVSYHQTHLGPGDQVLSLVGERGVGKTWLLKYLAKHDRRISPVAVYLDLERRNEFPEPEEYVRAVEEWVHIRCGDGKAILLLDSVPAYLDEHLRALEDSILRPHLTYRSSLVIMALEHPSQVCWRAPALRGGGSFSLLPFEEQQTLEQLRKLQKSGQVRNGLEAREVFKVSGGLPLFSYLLASKERTAAFELLLQHWLSRIPVGDCERVRHYLTAVCELEVLEHVSIQKVLEVYYHYLPEAMGYPAHPSGVRNLLRKYWLAQPMPRSPGRIVLGASVRCAAAELLKVYDAELHMLLKEATGVLHGGLE